MLNKDDGKTPNDTNRDPLIKAMTECDQEPAVIEGKEVVQHLEQLPKPLQERIAPKLPSKPTSQIPNHHEWLEIAKSCYDGQASMLYAVASTGDLTRGSMGGPYESVEEWEADLWSGLSSELAQCARMFEENPSLFDEDSIYTLDDVRAFESHADQMAEYWGELAENLES